MNINPAAGTIDYFNVPKLAKGDRAGKASAGEPDILERLAAMRLEMFAAAENLEFEKAARMRDELRKLESLAGEEARTGATGGAFDPYAPPSPRKARARGAGTAKAGAPRGTGRRYKT
jgi:excinuclease ABC subunit B